MKKALYRIYALLFFILAGPMASEASAQGMSGWSDEIVCRLMLSKPDEPRYTEEVASRNLNCPKYYEQSAKPESNSSSVIDVNLGIDDSTMFSEDFENAGQRGVRVDDRQDKWYIKQDDDGNSIYCNKITDDWTDFNFGSTGWSDYSIAYRMRFSAGKEGKVETHIRKTRGSDYRAHVVSFGKVKIQFSKNAIARGYVSTKTGEWLDIQLIASGANIKYLVDGEVVARATDDRVKNGSGMFAVSANSEVCIDNIIVNKT